MYTTATDSERGEAELLAQAVQGDREALGILLYQYYEPLAAYIRQRFGMEGPRGVDADDILQQTLIKVFQSIGRFHTQGAGSFYRWLKTIAEHTRIDEQRKQRRRPDQAAGKPPAGTAADASAVRLWEVLALSEETPSRSVARREAGQALAIALATLQPRQREAVCLVYLYELSPSEAADRMGTTRQAIHALVYRGLQRLREVMGSLSDYLSHP